MCKKLIFLILISAVLYGCAQQEQKQAVGDEILQEEPSSIPEIIQEEEETSEAAEETEVETPPAPSGSDESELLKSGTFVSVAKSVKGQVTIYRRQIDDEIVFALRSFRTEPGAKLYFILVQDSVENGYKIGGLQNIYGNYEYVIPRNVPIASYNKVVLYSESTKEVYGEARLS